MVAAQSGVMSNNPPVYDVIPMGEMAIKAWLKKHASAGSNPRR
jgi:hypothetical protein